MTKKTFAYTIPEAVKASGISRSALYLAIKKQQLHARKMGRRTLITADELQRFISDLPEMHSAAGT